MAKTSAKTKTVRLTLASQRDSLPTVTAARIGADPITDGEVVLRLKSKYTGKTHLVYFRLNRFRTENNATYIAQSWPKQLRKPSVGSPVEFILLDVKRASSF